MVGDDEGGAGASGRKPLTYTERSVVSMFLAADADDFVGSKRSTFFQGVSMIRSLSRPFSGHSYIYDGDGPEYKEGHMYHIRRLARWPGDIIDAEGHVAHGAL